MVTPMNCSCCWDSDVELYSCTEGHFSCSECLQTGIRLLVNENRNIACISDSCTGYYSDKILRTVIRDKQLIQKYNINTFVNMLSKIAIDNLYECPFCPNRVVIENDIIEMTTFFCMDGCKRYSCMRCKRDAHEGLCHQEQHTQEERATQEFLINCCGISFFRGDACNKVSCPRCKLYYCWICKQQIYNGYNHFRTGDCKLYGERPEPPQQQEITQIQRPTIGLMRPIQNGRRRISVRCSGLTSRRRPCSRMTLSASGLCQDHH